MAKSLLEQRPEIVANGRKEAEKILENLESRHRVSLQTREMVLPAKDSAAQDWITQQARSVRHGITCCWRKTWFTSGRAKVLGWRSC